MSYNILPEYTDFVSPDSLNGFGNPAVAAEIELANSTVNGWSDLVDSPQVIRASVSHRVRLARAELELLEPFEQQAVDAILSDRPLSPFLAYRLGICEGGSIVAALTAREGNGTALIADADFLHFLEWHNYKLRQEQTEFDQSGAAEALKQDYAAAFQAAINKGWIPEQAAASLVRLDQAALLVADQVQLVTAHRSGLHRIINGRHVIQISYRDADVRHTAFHELTHAMQGRAEHGQPTGLRRCFGAMGNLLNEAVVEHIAQSLAYGDMDAVDPTHPLRVEAVVNHSAQAIAEGKMQAFDPEHPVGASACYFIPRRIVHALCELGEQKVDIRLFVAALFEDDNASPRPHGSPYGQQLIESLRAAFPGKDLEGRLRDLENCAELSGERSETFYQAVSEFISQVTGDTVSPQE